MVQTQSDSGSQTSWANSPVAPCQTRTIRNKIAGQNSHLRELPLASVTRRSGTLPSSFGQKSVERVSNPKTTIKEENHEIGKP